MCIITLLLISIVVGTGPSAQSEQGQSGGTIESIEQVEETSPPREGTPLPTLSQARLAEFKLADTTGAARGLFDQDGPDLVVVAMISTTCPIANASIPEIRRLHDAVKRLVGGFSLSIQWSQRRPNQRLCMPGNVNWKCRCFLTPSSNWFENSRRRSFQKSSS